MSLPGGTLPRREKGALHAYGEADEFGIAGESEAANRMRAQLENAAEGDDHVIVFGESGTARRMGVERTALYRLMEKYGVKRER